jgi:hypothetical protein
VAWVAARSAYGAGSEDLRRLAGIEVSAAEFARVALEEGERVGALQAAREERWSEPVASDRPVFAPEFACERLVVEADATSVLTVRGEEHKMVYCARAYDAANRYEKGGGKRVGGESRFAASGGDFEVFKHSIDALANRMGARQARQIAFVADGAPCLWAMAAERLPGAVLIQDLWHVSEHMCGLAKMLHGEGTAQAMELGERWSTTLREGGVDGVLAELRELRKAHRGAKRKRITDEIRYLEEGRHRMDYPRYEAAGWPLGSGAIEATCKHLVKERMAVSGARWRRGNIPAIVALRLCRANAEWDRDFPPLEQTG